MKKTMMTLAAVFCCAMSLTMFTACGSDDDDNKTQVDDVTPVGAVMEHIFDVSDDMLDVLDMTVEYYDENGNLATEKLTQKQWKKTVKVAKLPVSLGACLKAQLKTGADDGVDDYTGKKLKFSQKYYCKAYSVTATGGVVDISGDEVGSTLTFDGAKLPELLASYKDGIIMKYLYDYADNGKVVASSWK